MSNRNTTGSPLSVTLDVGPAVHQNAGLARYAERLAATLLQHQAHAVDLTLLYNAHSGHALPPSLGTASVRTVSMGQYPWRIAALASQLLRTSLLRRVGPATGALSLYHATEHLLPYLPAPTVLTVHDLIFERYPQHHTLRNRLFLKLAMPRFVRAADAIIAVSGHTRDDLVSLYGTPPEKIHVVYEGIDPDFAPAGADEVTRIRNAYSPDRPYLLMVGTLEPRKNHLTALRALARLRAAGRPHRLIIAGGQGWLFEPIRAEVEAMGLVDDVHFTGYVPGADLPALYSGADCLLLPSLYEGFGFTVLEAMACGAPVVCSNVSSLPEVAGDAALTVDPLDDAALAASVMRLLDEPGLAESLRARGLRRAAGFRWERCAGETVAVYRETLARARYRVVQMQERGTLDRHPRSG